MKIGLNTERTTRGNASVDWMGILSVLLLACLAAAVSHAESLPKTVAYSAVPNGYFNEYAKDVAKVYDGFFFTIGSWDEGVSANIGLGDNSSPSTDWMARVRENIEHLASAGVCENLLGVCFDENGTWPSGDTLLSGDYTAKMARHFQAVGKAARELGFRGVSIDIEYCYKRYEFGHAVYTYNGYTCDDLIRAADAQGRAVIGAVLDAFPEAVVFTLPGELMIRPIGRAFLLGMLKGMAERDAPGGFHLGYERSYCLLDGGVSQTAIPLVADGAAELLLDGRERAYWRNRCDVAPGVWPLHMVETGGKDYPVRPWPEEMAELREQMKVLRSVAKRYIWSYSGAPLWYVPEAALEQRYGLKPQAIEHAAEVVKQWHEILADKTAGEPGRAKPLLDAVREYRDGRIAYAALCDRFGTPADWWILGPLANPFTQPAHAAPVYALNDVSPFVGCHGRDAMVHWFPFHNNEPTGSVSLRAAFDWRNTDNCSVQAVTLLTAQQAEQAVLHFGWDDGAVVWLNEEMILDRRSYPENGHGMQYRDRYLFEEHVPVTVPEGTNCLRVSCINLKGVWGFALRVTDPEGYPLESLRFSLPDARSSPDNQ